MPRGPAVLPTAALAGCASRAEPQAVTLIAVRHAEKVDPSGRARLDSTRYGASAPAP